jgi:hypothetical protein
MTPRVHGVAVFLDFCGSAGAQENFPVCRIWREGFSPSGGRIEDYSPVPSARLYSQFITQRTQRRRARKGKRGRKEFSSHNAFMENRTTQTHKKAPLLGGVDQLPLEVTRVTF